MIINKIRIHKSIWVPIPAVFLGIVLSGVIESIFFNGPSLDFIELCILAGAGIGIGAIVWLPSALLCLFIESSIINDKTTKRHIQFLLFCEALIPFLFFIGIMGSRRDGVLIIMSFVILMLAQLVRWFYIKRKGKLYRIGVNES